MALLFLMIKANLLQNGNFASNVQCTRIICPVPVTSIQPWTGQGSVQLTSTQMLDLNSDDGPNIINQRVLIKKGNYALTFKVGQRPCGPEVKSGFVQVIGSPRFNFDIPQDQFQTIRIAFNAPASVYYTFQIGSTTTGSCGFLIGDVNLQEISNLNASSLGLEQSNGTGNTLSAYNFQCGHIILVSLGLVVFLVALFISHRRRSRQQLPVYTMIKS